MPTLILLCIFRRQFLHLVASQSKRNWPSGNPYAVTVSPDDEIVEVVEIYTSMLSILAFRSSITETILPHFTGNIRAFYCTIMISEWIFKPQISGHLSICPWGFLRVHHQIATMGNSWKRTQPVWSVVIVFFSLNAVLTTFSSTILYSFFRLLLSSA